MRLWTYQHPAVLKVLLQGERYYCTWDCVPSLKWQQAYRWMIEQMALRNIQTGEFAPVWAWHSVNRLGGKPDMDCAQALLSENQIAEGIDLLAFEVPDHLALVSLYGPWNLILHRFLDGEIPETQEITDCFAAQLQPRRGRPKLYFDAIQACLPFIDPGWLVSSETLDTVSMLEERRIAMEAVLVSYNYLSR
ncbi:MAG: DUF3841 domain-containing protein [Bacteroidota bacterium]